MMKQVRHLKYEEDQKEIKNKMLTPVEHVFGNHKHCGSWCYFLKAEKEGKNTYLPTIYRYIVNLLIKRLINR